MYVKPSRLWLDTGDRNCNAVVGSPDLGAPAGRIYHIVGKKHAAKTTFVAWLAATAQRQHNAFVIWIDAENSFDKRHFRRQGLRSHSDHFHLIYPKMLIRKTAYKKGKKTSKAGSAFLQSCEYLFEEAEEVMKIIKEDFPDRPIFVVVDSIAALQTEMAIDKGFAGQNQRSKLDRAQFLSDSLPRWQSLVKNFTAWLFLINQIRVNPNQLFGNPEYSPGGFAPGHYSHIELGLRRKGTGIEGEGANSKIGGYMINNKNKAGGGSREGQLCLYTAWADREKRKAWSFGPFKKKKKEAA